MNFSLLQNVRIVEGPGCVAKVGEILKEAGYSKAFLVFDCGVKAAGIVDKVVAALDSAGVAHVLFDRVLPDPPADIVDEGAEHCRREGCDCVVGLGGGSSIDTAKGINLLRFNDGNILSYASPDTPMKRSPGLLSIPTTAGTGSELSNGLIISNPGEGVKVPILAVNAMSEYAVIDPELTLGMPPGLTIATGLDVFSHACEGYTSILANAMTDMLCEKIMENVAAYLPAAHRDGSSLEARERMLVSASLGGWMLAQASAMWGIPLRMSSAADCIFPTGWHAPILCRSHWNSSRQPFPPRSEKWEKSWERSSREAKRWRKSEGRPRMLTGILPPRCWE